MKKKILGLALLLVLGWWFTRFASNDRVWQKDVAQVAWAEMDGDRVRIHNIRNFEYKTENDYEPRWDTREVKISDIKGLDLFVSHWGSPWIAHALVSFDFGNGQYLTASIEARKEEGEAYSAVLGFFRQYEIIYILADERDVVRLRTNYRTDEEVRLYRTRTTAADAQALFREYLSWMNRVREQPEWYNALTNNCTSAFNHFLTSRHIGGVSAWDWRLLANGKGEQMLYELGNLVDGGLPFPELEQKALINAKAKAANDAPDFSARIRQGLPGF